MTDMMKKYTDKHMKFKFDYSKKFIMVFIDGKLDGFIWNCEKVILVGGDKVVSSEFFA